MGKSVCGGSSLKKLFFEQPYWTDLVNWLDIRLVRLAGDTMSGILSGKVCYLTYDQYKKREQETAELEASKGLYRTFLIY